MVKVNPASINDLAHLKESGTPVTLTSHPGNASLYKQVLWSCGVPEHLWDVTCCQADANNWPTHRLKDGVAEPLLDESLMRKIKLETSPSRRYITAYQPTIAGGRLGRFHVKVCQQLFPGVISSCSRLLLSEQEKLREVFGFLAETRQETVFARFITPDGIAVPARESGLKASDLVDSFIKLLQELDHLLFSDEPITTKGGACYDGVMVPLATMLVQYWQTGRVDRYDISGPDMINYASKPEHQRSLTEMLTHIHRWNPRLAPKTIVSHMLPGTVARVGCIPGHISEQVMNRKVKVLSNGYQLSNTAYKRLAWEAAKDDEQHWPIRISASKDHYFSQHDLLAASSPLKVDDFWKNIPLTELGETLMRANNLLKIKAK